MLNDVILERIQRQSRQSMRDEMLIIREIVQEITLLGLWRAKFYENAAFYGGTCLRILYGLPRFSEDLDFSLLEPNPNFKLMKYEKYIRQELEAFGFEVTIESQVSKKESPIESAFIKGNTMIHLLKIKSQFKTHKEANFKIKFEIDTNPPGGFETEVTYIYWPLPFSVKTYSLPDLFSGKLHACLCRSRRINIKGRDWYDYLWYLSRQTELNLKHLEQRMKQSGHLQENTRLTSDLFKELLYTRINEINFDDAKKDVLPFISDKSSLDSWSVKLFQNSISHIKIIEF